MATAVLALTTKHFLYFRSVLLHICSLRAHQDHSFEDDQASSPCGVMSFLQAYFEVMRQAIDEFVSVRGEIVHQFPQWCFFEDFLFFSSVIGGILHVLLLSCRCSIPLMQLIDELGCEITKVGLRSETSTSHSFLINRIIRI